MDDLLHSLGTPGQGPTRAQHVAAAPNGASGSEGAAFGQAFDAMAEADPASTDDASDSAATLHPPAATLAEDQTLPLTEADAVHKGEVTEPDVPAMDAMLPSQAHRPDAPVGLATRQPLLTNAAPAPNPAAMTMTGSQKGDLHHARPGQNITPQDLPRSAVPAPAAPATGVETTVKTVPSAPRPSSQMPTQQMQTPVVQTPQMQMPHVPPMRSPADGPAPSAVSASPPKADAIPSAITMGQGSNAPATGTDPAVPTNTQTGQATTPSTGLATARAREETTVQSLPPNTPSKPLAPDSTSLSGTAPLPHEANAPALRASIAPSQSKDAPTTPPMVSANRTDITVMMPHARDAAAPASSADTAGDMLLPDRPKDRGADRPPRAGTGDFTPVRVGAWQSAAKAQTAPDPTYAAQPTGPVPLLTPSIEAGHIPIDGLEFSVQSSALTTTSLTTLGTSLPPQAPAAYAHAVATQIARTLADPGRDPGGMVELALDPPELGRLRMQMVDVAGVLTLSIMAERPETADLMRRHLELLANEFAQQGLDAPNVQISHGDAGSHGQAGNGDGPDDPSSHTPNLPDMAPNPAALSRTASGTLDLRL